MADDDEIVQGHQVDLDEVRHVWVGRRGDAFLIEFKNKDGKSTRLCLSQEAGDALGHLLRKQIPDPGEMVKSFFRIMTTVKGEAKPEYGWVQVKPDTAPLPTEP